MLKGYLERLILGQDLTAEESEQAMDRIIDDAESLCQIAAFLVLLRAKHETPDEIFGIIKALQKHMQKIFFDFPVLDIVGTGGDRANTVNISTGAGILAASCGVKMVKHGNRSVSSQCGSADVLEELGIKINMEANNVIKSVIETGFGFCFAPNFHPAFKKINPIRKELVIPTCFNILGPLLNPAQAKYLMIGVFDENLLNLMAEVLIKLKVEHALVFHTNGTDELSCIGPAQVIEITGSEKQNYILDPQHFGFAKCKLQDLQGGSAQHNAKLLVEVFAGKENPLADTLIFNAAVALYVYGRADSIEKAIPIVKENIKNNNAMFMLNRIKGGCISG